MYAKFNGDESTGTRVIKVYIHLHKLTFIHIDYLNLIIDLRNRLITVLTTLIFIAIVSTVVLTVTEKGGINTKAVGTLKHIISCTVGLFWNDQTELLIVTFLFLYFFFFLRERKIYFCTVYGVYNPSKVVLGSCQIDKSNSD